ncbi:hypothetical protein BOX15_Mlig018064g1 [Macrostomum lignano]|uniref:LRAT domain-containing protein n=1 Tax=Macrostomum lignano TaxID=282301 RepID=A0A267GD52_9PLAT|nr:hypothetical protein BOX15_Mlig018064g1 [Macrostomum lignano]
MAEAGLNRCESCERDISKCGSIYCGDCDELFDREFAVEDRLCCPKCESSSVDAVPDNTNILCKYCLSAASTDSPSLPNSLHTKEDCKLAQPEAPALHRSVSSPGTKHAHVRDPCLIACCRRCNNKYKPTDELASCPKCGQEADHFEELNGEIAEVSLSKKASEPSTEQPPCSMNYSEELWRFVGCSCQNNEPLLFDLDKADSLMVSFYCPDCQLPYSRYIFQFEISGEHCPKCESGRVETDEISAGEEVVLCHNCDGKMSKRRIDELCSNAKHEVQRQLNNDHVKQTDCERCGKPAAEIGFEDREGSTWLVQHCSACGNCESICDIEPAQTPAPAEVPDGFEELESHCCGLSHLHPVEGDSGNNLLECACGKSSPICLDNCRDSRIPKTVPELRRALPRHSSSEMGLPFQIAKLKSAADLKPGDHLDFKRRFYCHHAIVVEVLEDTQQVALIEYTGEIDARTASAALAFAAKGTIQKTLYPFADVEKDGRLVQYHSLDCFSPKVVLKRAFEREKETAYHVGQCNCEHFCIWAKSGLDLSRQVDSFKKKMKDALESPILDAILNGIGKLGSGKKRVGMAVDIVQDLRTELLELVSIPKGASNQILRTVLRLGLKWSIRGLPLLVSLVTRNASFFTHLPKLDLDSYLMKPLAEAAANSLLPIKDKEDNKD